MLGQPVEALRQQAHVVAAGHELPQGRRPGPGRYDVQPGHAGRLGGGLDLAAAEQVVGQGGSGAEPEQQVQGG